MLELVNLEEVLAASYESVSRILPFGRELWENSNGVIRPRMHQIIRIHEAVRNGTKRLVLEDTTSSGKTLNAIAIKGLMDQDSGRKNRALLIAPNQAIESAWREDEINRYTQALGLSNQTTIRLEDLDPITLERDIIQVNYDKLSRTDTESYTNQHLNRLRQLVPNVDLVIVDECHNLKNIDANRTRAFVDVVEATRDKNFLMLSASAIPNRVEDVGFLLYMFNPKKFQHYATNPFDYNMDNFSVRNARNSSGWFTLTREDLKQLFNLPELHFGDSELGLNARHEFEMPESDTQRYFDEWKQESKGLGKISRLSRILLQSEFGEIKRVCEQIHDKRPDAQVGIFSFYTEGFSEELASLLNKRFPGQAAVIRGDNPSGNSTREKVRERVELARRFNNGDIKYLVNTISTVSEAISFVTQDRPAYVIFAEPPIVPANFDQAVGRFYRLQQRAPVYVIEMVPKSTLLDSMMREETDRRKCDGVRYRTSWIPGTLFQDNPRIRGEKQEQIRKVTLGIKLDEVAETLCIEEGSQDERAYATIPKQIESKPKSANKSFNDGLKVVRKFIGRPVEELQNSPDRRYLVESYSSDEWGITSSADTNKAIKRIIETVEKVEGRTLEKILDWGCGTACLARTLKRGIVNLDTIPEMLENGKIKCEEEGILELQEFVLGNARKVPYPDCHFDLVSSAYALQYNAQGFQHRRDIEEILKETNRALRLGGYGIFALPNQATGTTQLADKSIDVLKSMIEKYGFRMVFSDFTSGHAINPETQKENKIFRGVHVLLYQKIEDRNTLLEDGYQDVFIFSPYKLLGIGGKRKIEGKTNGCGQYKSRGFSSEIFKTREGEELSKAVYSALTRSLPGEAK